MCVLLATRYFDECCKMCVLLVTRYFDECCEMCVLIATCYFDGSLRDVCFDSIRWLRFGPLLDTLVWLSPIGSCSLVLVLGCDSWMCGRALFFTFRPDLLTVASSCVTPFRLVLYVHSLLVFGCYPRLG